MLFMKLVSFVLGAVEGWRKLKLPRGVGGGLPELKTYKQNGEGVGGSVWSVPAVECTGGERLVGNARASLLGSALF